MRALILSLITLSLSACVPLYVPPVPVRDRMPPPMQLDIGGSSGLRLRGERLELSVQINALPDEGWLSLQWYSPQNRKVASDALWLAREDVGNSRTALLPGDIEVTSGQWRAVVSFESDLLRQFALTVPEPQEDEEP